MNSGFIAPGGLNLSLNPLQHKPGDMVICHNTTGDTFGAKRKRPGYVPYLGTPDTSQVTTLFNFTKEDGTTMFNYRYSGTQLYYSRQGNGSWTACGSGNFSIGENIGNATFDGTIMIVGDGIGSTRTTTSGTSFSNSAGAPASNSFVDYQNRIYAKRNSDMFFSNIGSPASWVGGDSSSIHIPGPGAIDSLMKVSDRIVTVKDSGIMHRWDGYNLYDLSTVLGPTSPQSISEVEGFKFYLTRVGFFGFDGNKPEIVSNPIEKYIYNYSGSAIQGTTFDNAPSEVHRYEYITSVGTITDDLTMNTLSDTLAVYDYQTSEWYTWSFANRPTSFLSYHDVNNGSQQLIFGDRNGQCYTYGNDATSDNGTAISVHMEGVITMNTLLEKKWNMIRFAFNPGMEGEVSIAVSNSFTDKPWKTLEEAVSGIVECKFKGDRGVYLHWRITESSSSRGLQWNGLEFDADPIYHK